VEVRTGTGTDKVILKIFPIKGKCALSSLEANSIADPDCSGSRFEAFPAYDLVESANKRRFHLTVHFFILSL